VVTLVLPDTYGPGDPRCKVFRVLHEAARKRDILDMSPGGQCLDLVHADDVADAFVHVANLAQKLPTGCHHFGVSSGRHLTLREAVALWHSSGGSCPEIRWGTRPYGAREHFMPHLPTPLPGWAPSVALEVGLYNLAQSFRVE
jgi:nucleoside-diphosphate-sugar epimerase